MRKKLQSIRLHLAALREDTRGSVAVEAALVLPMLLWGFVAMFIFFDGYRTRSVNEKAAYTIADMISRETAAIDSDFMDGAFSLFNLLAKSDGDTGLRVSVVKWDSIDEEYELEWSAVKGAAEVVDAATMLEWQDMLPVMSAGENLIVVETNALFDPSLDVGLTQLNVDTFIFTRPRFAPQIVWSSGGSV